MVGIGLLDSHEINPSSTTANSKRSIDSTSDENVSTILANIFLLDLTERHTVVAQERAQGEQNHDSPDAEHGAANGAHQRWESVAGATGRAAARLLVLLVCHCSFYF